MTVLAAYQGNGFAVIGADSRATEDGGFYLELATPKIVKNGDYLIAVSGASRGGNIAQFGWTPPRAPRSNKKDVLDRFVTKTLIPSLRRAFVAAGFEAKDDGEAAWTESNMIIIVNGVVYPIFNDYSWDREIRNVYFAGSGSELACGALAMVNMGECADDPELAIKYVSKAVEVACRWNAYCALPVHVEVQYQK